MGKRKAVWIHEDQFAYHQSLAEYDGATVPATMKRLTLILKRAGIENLTNLEEKLKHPATQ